MNFDVTILGCGSATPTLKHSPSAQVVQYGTEALLIDCGEGTQLKLRRSGFNFQRISHIFISHLHGDHYLGLQGLLSTMHLLGRTKAIHIYAHADLEAATHQQLKISNSFLRFRIHWHPLTYIGLTHILNLKYLDVFSFPLNHRIPTCGFLVREKPRDLKIRKEALEKYKPPVARIRQIKKGADLTLEDGSIVPNRELTYPPFPERSYAYCSDTAYQPVTAEYVKACDLLYHESTFLDKEAERAEATFHSTARQAALVAREGNVKRLVLGHFSARYKHLKPFEIEAKSVFENVILAEEGATLEVGG